MLTEFSLLRRVCFGSCRSHALPYPQTCVLDRHAEELVFVLLVVGGKGVLVEQYEFRVIRQAFAKSGRFFLIVAIRLDSRCMRSSLVIVDARLCHILFSNDSHD